MTAVAFVGSDDICAASLKPYRDCDRLPRHQHVFSDPNREGALYLGWATLHPKPMVPPHEADAWPWRVDSPGTPVL